MQIIDKSPAVGELRRKEETKRLQYIMRVFSLNDTSQDTYRLYNQNGTKYVGVVQLTRIEKGCSQVPFLK